MPRPSGGPLTLCGPKYFVAAFSPTALYVDLYEVGNKDPFHRERVPLELGTDFPTQTIVSVGEEATLTLSMTVISPCTLSKVSLELSSPRHGDGEWLVSGSVKAIQTVNADTHGGKVEREVSLFNRPHDQPLRAVHKGMIKLDREVLLAPLLFDRDHIVKMDQHHLECGYPAAGIDPDNDVLNGVGCYLSVVVDLRLVDSGDKTGRPLPVEGVCRYQFKCSHASGALFRATLKFNTEIEVSVILRPSLGIMSAMDGEPYECGLELYRPSDTQKRPSSSTDEVDEVESELKRPIRRGPRLKRATN